ncbi:hypothetical protein [Microbacterium sp. G2-8]|uniref:hypothetical protein n=1 Tax=Microbacterium sp. G2-8 TaxID=2842454 RepID=UPI001C89D01E|nr:hypothetical protein [Microbacterium sp. G2-8]
MDLGALFAPAVVGAVIGVAALVAGGIGVGVLVARARRTGDEISPGQIPPAVADVLGRLDVLRGVYLARERYPVAARTARSIRDVTRGVGDLFQRLSSSGEDLARAEHEYVPALGRLATALDRGYLLAMIETPELWDDRDRRIAEVEQALDDVAHRASEDATDLTMRRAIRAETSLDSLSARTELRAWDRDFRDAAGE